MITPTKPGWYRVRLKPRDADEDTPLHSDEWVHVLWQPDSEWPVQIPGNGFYAEWVTEWGEPIDDIIAERDSLRAEVERLGGDFEVRRPDGVEIVGPVAMLGFIERVLTDAGAAPEDGDSLADAVASIAEERDRMTALRNEFRERARVAELELCGLRKARPPVVARARREDAAMTRQERAIAALAALRADGWTLPTSTVPIDLLLDTKADALDVIAERDSLRAEVERLEIERGKAISVADYEARIRAEERAKIAAWLETRHRARSCRLSDEFREGRQDELADIIDAITNNEHNAP